MSDKNTHPVMEPLIEKAKIQEDFRRGRRVTGLVDNLWKSTGPIFLFYQNDNGLPEFGYIGCPGYDLTDSFYSILTKFLMSFSKWAVRCYRKKNEENERHR